MRGQGQRGSITCTLCTPASCCSRLKAPGPVMAALANLTPPESEGECSSTCQEGAGEDHGSPHHRIAESDMSPGLKPHSRSSNKHALASHPDPEPAITS